MSTDDVASRSPTPTSPDSPRDGRWHKSNLEEYELESEGEGRLPFMLTMPEIKLLGIAGVRSSI